MSQNLIPTTESPHPDPLQALLTRAAFAPITNVGWIRVTGDDRVRWLNGMVTNNIAALKPGEGCYNFFLNAQGRIQGDCTAWMQEDSILLETAADRIPALLTLLDHFIIMDDVELTVMEDRAGLIVLGPEASHVLRKHGFADRAGERLFLSEDRARNLHFVSGFSPLSPAFEIWSDLITIDALQTELALTTVQATTADLEQLRILSGTPIYGTDIRNSDTAKDLPQETNQTRALHFAKGCYLGQEIVERIRSRGAVHRTFTGFILHGEPAAPGTILTADDRPIGELTSVTSINSRLLAPNYHLEDQPVAQIALGYIRREALERDAGITYPGGTATPATLPFQLNESRR